MRLTKQVVEGGSGEFLQIDPGTKSLYFAAELLATAMPVFYLNAAEKTLRSAGISGRPLASLLDQLGARMLRNCRAGTRISGGGPLASCPSDLAELYLKTAAAELPAIASLLGHSEEYELKSAIQNGLEPLVCHTQVKHAEALSMEIEAARD
jgi:hypothetical protein